MGGRRGRGLGNISDDDARFTIGAMPQLCLDFVAPADALFSVGAARFDGQSRALGSRRLFTFGR